MMESKMQLPIFRAKRLNSNEIVFGVPREDSQGSFEMIINTCDDGVCGVIQRFIEVDTLAISFDGGESYYDNFDLADKILKSHEIDRLQHKTKLCKIKKRQRKKIHQKRMKRWKIALEKLSLLDWK